MLFLPLLLLVLLAFVERVVSPHVFACPCCFFRFVFVMLFVCGSDGWVHKAQPQSQAQPNRFHKHYYCAALHKQSPPGLVLFSFCLPLLAVSSED